MSYRTSLTLDEETRTAARQLASQYGCSTAEAIRRAIVQQRNTMLGTPRESRPDKTKILERLYELFEGSDPEEEIRRLKEQDEGF